MRKAVWGRLGALLFMALIASGGSQAAAGPDNKAADAAIRAGLKGLNDKLVVESVTKTPVSGIFQVIMATGEILYMSGDGQFLFGGDLMKVEKEGRLENLTEKIRSQQVQKALAALDTKDLIVFPAEGKRKSIMYIFTDVDCGYCRKLHQEVPELNSKGVEVRYLAFPRGGERAPAYAKMVSAWCAQDRRAAMTTLKTGGSLASATCDNPVAEQYELGATLGVRGTPAIYLEDGRAVPGYQPAPALLKMMGI